MKREGGFISYIEGLRTYLRRRGLPGPDQAETPPPLRYPLPEPYLRELGSKTLPTLITVPNQDLTTLCLQYQNRDLPSYAGVRRANRRPTFTLGEEEWLTLYFWALPLPS
jgi:hypothetical protein